ncbi:DUF4395 domain-containing protein [Microbacterium sp. P01]|uniref:DUF4395 domain-containing protein n=1 Tax=unclassified Microbacterium TaxID=2609290 RepID=UPI00367259B9
MSESDSTVVSSGTAGGIDPRGPRFAAAITSAVVLIATFFAATGISAARDGSTWSLPDASLAQRAGDAGFVLFAVIALLFLWAVAFPASQPYGVLFRTAVRPRLAPPAELEDPRPPRFAQGVGLFVVTVGLVLHLLGVPLALPIAGAAAFLAAFLNASIGLCLGCQLYLLFVRAGVLGRHSATA